MNRPHFKTLDMKLSAKPLSCAQLPSHVRQDMSHLFDLYLYPSQYYLHQRQTSSSQWQKLSRWLPLLASLLFLFGVLILLQRFTFLKAPYTDSCQDCRSWWWRGLQAKPELEPQDFPSASVAKADSPPLLTVLIAGAVHPPQDDSKTSKGDGHYHSSDLGEKAAVSQSDSVSITSNGETFPDSVSGSSHEPMQLSSADGSYGTDYAVPSDLAPINKQLPG